MHSLLCVVSMLGDAWDNILATLVEPEGWRGGKASMLWPVVIHFATGFFFLN